jgi:hypothetical protein
MRQLRPKSAPVPTPEEFAEEGRRIQRAQEIERQRREALLPPDLRRPVDSGRDATNGTP